MDVSESSECNYCKLTFTEPILYWKHVFQDNCDSSNQVVVSLQQPTPITHSSILMQCATKSKTLMEISDLNNETVTTAEPSSTNLQKSQITGTNTLLQRDLYSSVSSNNISSNGIGPGIKRMDVGCNKYFCVICSAAISDQLAVKQHEEGRKHKKATLSLLSELREKFPEDKCFTNELKSNFSLYDTCIQNGGTAVTKNVDSSICENRSKLIDCSGTSTLDNPKSLNRNNLQNTEDYRPSNFIHLPKTTPVVGHDQVNLSSLSQNSLGTMPQNQLKPILRNLCISQLMSLLSDPNYCNNIDRTEDPNQMLISQLRLKCCKDLANYIKFDADEQKIVDSSCGVLSSSDSSSNRAFNKDGNCILENTLHNILILSWCQQLQQLNSD